MDFNLNNVVRSAALVIVGLPLTGAVFLGVLDSTSKSAAQKEVEQLKAELTVPCIQWSVTKPDSGLERDAKNTVDDVMGGSGIDYKQLCGWVL